MKSRVLTPKQSCFCREYLVDLNATAAAKRAGYAKGSAEVQGCRLLKNDKVASRIAELQAEAADRNKVTVDAVIAKLGNLRDQAVAAKQMGPAVRHSASGYVSPVELDDNGARHSARSVAWYLRVSVHARRSWPVCPLSLMPPRLAACPRAEPAQSAGSSSRATVSLPCSPDARLPRSGRARKRVLRP